MHREKIIQDVFVDEQTGLTVYEDIRGRFHMVTQIPYPVMATDDRKYLQSLVRGGWPNTNGYHKIPDSLNGGYLDYTVPEDKIYNMAFIIASQSGTSLSSIGLFVNDTLRVGVPLRDSISYVLYDRIRLPAGVTISLRFMPPSKSTEFGICAGGHLSNLE